MRRLRPSLVDLEQTVSQLPAKDCTIGASYPYPREDEVLPLTAYWRKAKAGDRITQENTWGTASPAFALASLRR